MDINHRLGLAILAADGRGITTSLLGLHSVSISDKKFRERENFFRAAETVAAGSTGFFRLPKCHRVSTSFGSAPTTG
jgi:hypothetical protein